MNDVCDEAAQLVFPARPNRPVSDDELRTYERDGVVCLRGILPVEWVRSVGDAIDLLLTDGSMADLTTVAIAPDSLPAQRGRFFAGTDHWRASQNFATAALLSPLPEIAASLMATSNVFLYEDSVLVKEPRSAEDTRWHQDLAYFNLTGSQICTMWLSTDTVSGESGGLSFITGSHRDGVLYRPTFFVNDDPLPGTDGSDIATLEVDPQSVVSFDMEPGDMTVHHSLTIHSAGPNRSPTTSRRALSTRYVGDDARFFARPGVPQKRRLAAFADGTPMDGAVVPKVWPVG